jgi:hypothetical protein
VATFDIPTPANARQVPFLLARPTATVEGFKRSRVQGFRVRGGTMGDDVMDKRLLALPDDEDELEDDDEDDDDDFDEDDEEFEDDEDEDDEELDEDEDLEEE